MTGCEVEVFSWLGAKIALTGVAMIAIFGSLFAVTKDKAGAQDINIASVVGLFVSFVIAEAGVFVLIWQ